ncbi:hypothetical protein MMPV_004748 [Pyropia vietnamensis]
MTSKRPRSGSPSDDSEEDEITPVRSRGTAAGGPAPASDTDEELAPARRKRRGAPDANGDVGGRGGVGANGHADVDLWPEEDGVDVERERGDVTDDGEEGDEEDNDAVRLPASGVRPPTSASRSRATAIQDEDEDDEAGNVDLDGSEDDSVAGVDSSAVAQHTSDALAARFGFAQVGILEKVRVENFMCHSCFEFDFGPNINIINGQNGSGKSAIVAALQIGLGVKASKTERARKISDHIMHGKEWALISIRIRNHAAEDGDTGLCFRPDVYGDAVVVERKITKTSTVLTFKNARGHRVTPEQTARAELDAILDTFNLQVDNPIAILTQQKSKQFLLSGKDGAMYDFFQEATLLSAAHEELLTAQQCSSDVQELLKQKRGLRPEIENQLQALETRFNEAKDMRSLAARLDELHRKFAWSMVAEYEAELEVRSKKADELRERLEYLASQLETRKAKADDVRERLSQATDAFDEAVRTHTDLRRAAAAVEADVKVKKSELGRKAREVEAAVRGVRDAEAAVCKAEGEKQRIIQRHLASSRDKAGLQARFDTARAEAEGAQIRLDALTEAKATADHEWRELSQAREELVRDRMAREGEYRAAEAEFRGLSRSAQNEVAKWGPYMPDLLVQIDIAFRQRRFHAKPVGPIGALVSVLDRRWARAIQVCVGLGTLNTFLVLDGHDEKVLREIGHTLPSGGGRALNLNIAIAGINRARYSVTSGHKPNVNYPTMLDMVSVSHNAAYNALVDFARIEQQVLVEDPAEHRRIGYTPTNNLAQAWTPDASRAYVSSRAEIFRSDTSNASVLLGADMASTIAAAKAALSAAQTAMEASRTRFLAHETQLSAAAKAKNTAKANVDAAQRALITLKRSVQQLEDALDQTTVALDTTVNDKEIERCRDELIEARQRLAATEAAIEELEEAAAAAEARFIAEKNIVDKAGEAKQAAQATLNTLSAELKRCETKRKAVAAEHGAAQIQSTAYDKEVENMTADVAKETSMARTICPERIDTSGVTSRQLEAEIKGCQRRLDAEQERRDNRTLEEIEAEFVSAQKRKAINDATLRSVKDMATSIAHGVVFRRKQLNKLSRYLRLLASFYFSEFMRTRGHKGKLLFDTKARSLQFRVCMASHKKADGGLYKTTDLRSLSGGERSYTTLCFMLALGESMVLPVRIMDEFDVFMDEANRHAAYKTLVDFAKQRLSDRQLIFITPLTLPAVTPGPAVKIQKLKPPGRL